jgi:glycosyltransferase involved in cell wall biosynthesis
MLYLILPCGSTFGWGICGKYLVRELSDHTEVALISEEFDLQTIADELDFHFLKSKHIDLQEISAATVEDLLEVDQPVLQAITDHNLKPWHVNVKGPFTAGYTFFENNILNPRYIENGKKHFEVIVTGSTWCETVLKDHGLENVTTIVQGVDPQLFNPLHSEKSLFKDRFVIFSGGKFELRKGQDIVIKSYKVLQYRHPDVMLVNAWFNPWPFSMKTMEGTPHIKCRLPNQDYMHTINHVLVENGIDLQRVITLMPRSNAQMARLYKNTDIGLFPNRCEGGTNLVLMEYMACAKPVIASYSSGHKDILTPANAMLIKHMRPMNITSGDKLQAIWDDPDIDETIAHLEAAYQNKKDLVLMGEQAGKDLANFSWKNTAASFYHLLTRQVL